MPRMVFSQDGLTGGFQASIEGGGLGRRLAGPKFCGRSKELLVVELNRAEAMEVLWHLSQDYPDLAHEYAAKHPQHNPDGECKGPPCACQSHPGLGPLFNKGAERDE